MEFWGVEVKSGDPCEVPIGATKVLHLSQVCLGESNIATSESVYLYTQVQGKKLVLGKLHSENLLQQQFDLVFDKSFTISHSWKHGTAYFLGYLGVSKDSDSESKYPGKPSPAANKKDAKPGKADSDSDSDSAAHYWPSFAPGNDDSSDDTNDSSDNRSEEEETPMNQSRNQDRTILRANHVPNLADRKKAEKHIGNPHPRMRRPVAKKANVKTAVKKNDSEEEDDEDEQNKQTGKKRPNESKDATTNKKARVIKQEPQD